jgi:hypothetical protein
VKERLKNSLAPLLYHKSYSRSLFTLFGIVIKECSVSFNQFFTWRYPIRSLLKTLGIIVSSLAKFFLGRSTKFSYSFTGEDRILESIIKKRITESGFFVDVGCNHPVFLSNTFSFYRRGWRGICIDANEHLIKKYRLFRPRDKAICALISNTNEERNFYQMTNDVLSTTESQMLHTYTEQGQRYKALSMIPTSLTRILDEVGAPHSFDLLSIDTEEHDFNVLQSLDLQKYSPQIIVIEAEDFKPDDPVTHPVYNYLIARGYILLGFVLTNLYFRKSKDNNL